MIPPGRHHNVGALMHHHRYGVGPLAGYRRDQVAAPVAIVAADEYPPGMCWVFCRYEDNGIHAHLPHEVRPERGTP